jgi:hypothetical protein
MVQRFQSVIFTGLLLLLLSGCATIHQMDVAKLKVISASTVISEPAKWQEILKDIQEGNEVVFHIREGQEFPLKINIEHPLVKLQACKNSVIFTHDTFLLISKSNMEISLDGQRWVKMSDFRSQRKLFGAEKGAFSVGFGATQEEGTQITVNLSVK